MQITLTEINELYDNSRNEGDAFRNIVKSVRGIFWFTYPSDSWRHLNIKNPLKGETQTVDAIEGYDAINEVALKYSEQDIPPSTKLDWFIADVLMVMAHTKFTNESMKNYSKFLNWFTYSQSEYKAHFMIAWLIWRFFLKGLKWVLMIGITGLLVVSMAYENSTHYSAIFLVGWLALLYFARRRRIKKGEEINNAYNKKSDLILRAYSQLSSEIINWEVFYDEINTIRRDGVELPSGLFALANKRAKSS